MKNIFLSKMCISDPDIWLYGFKVSQYFFVVKRRQSGIFYFTTSNFMDFFKALFLFDTLRGRLSSFDDFYKRPILSELEFNNRNCLKPVYKIESMLCTCKYLRTLQNTTKFSQVFPESCVFLCIFSMKFPE